MNLWPLNGISKPKIILQMALHFLLRSMLRAGHFKIAKRAAIYHSGVSTVNGEFLLAEMEKEKLERQGMGVVQGGVFLGLSTQRKFFVF